MNIGTNSYYSNIEYNSQSDIYYDFPSHETLNIKFNMSEKTFSQLMKPKDIYFKFINNEYDLFYFVYHILYTYSTKYYEFYNYLDIEIQHLLYAIICDGQNFKYFEEKLQIEITSFPHRDGQYDFYHRDLFGKDSYILWFNIKFPSNNCYHVHFTLTPEALEINYKELIITHTTYTIDPLFLFQDCEDDHILRKNALENYERNKKNDAGQYDFKYRESILPTYFD